MNFSTLQPQAGDTERILEAKILLVLLQGGGGSGTGSVQFGTPGGSVANGGIIYDGNGNVWVDLDPTGSHDWQKIISAEAAAAPMMVSAPMMESASRSEPAPALVQPIETATPSLPEVKLPPSRLSKWVSSAKVMLLSFFAMLMLVVPFDTAGQLPPPLLHTPLTTNPVSGAPLDAYSPSWNDAQRKWDFFAKVPTTRTLTIDGVAHNLTTDQSWTTSGGTMNSNQFTSGSVVSIKDGATVTNIQFYAQTNYGYLTLEQSPNAASFVRLDGTNGALNITEDTETWGDLNCGNITMYGGNLHVGVDAFITNNFYLLGSGISASTILLTDANKRAQSLANGGAGTFLQGTTPPTYTSDGSLLTGLTESQISGLTSDLAGKVPTSRALTINGTALDLSTDRSWSVGTVTSVGASGPAGFSWSSPVTGSGTLTATTPGPVLTNGESLSVTVSNQFAVDITHAFVASNATASAIGGFDAAHQVTNIVLDTGLSLSSGKLSLSGIANASLANSTITVSAGSGISVSGSPVALGGTVTVSATGSPGGGNPLVDTNAVSGGVLILGDSRTGPAGDAILTLTNKSDGGRSRINVQRNGVDSTVIFMTPTRVTLDANGGSVLDSDSASGGSTALYYPAAGGASEVFNASSSQTIIRAVNQSAFISSDGSTTTLYADSGSTKLTLGASSVAVDSGTPFSAGSVTANQFNGSGGGAATLSSSSGDIVLSPNSGNTTNNGTLSVAGGVMERTNIVAGIFNMSEGENSTNSTGNFTMTSPMGWNTSGKVIHKTLITFYGDGSDRTITPPPNCWLYWLGTNAATFHNTNFVQGFMCGVYGKWTNLYIGPGR